jgi:tetratricopeptide (TPR) repeat protein
VDQIGRELGVDYVLEGSARREGERVRITAELVHVRDQAQLWAETYERELSGLLALQSEVARAVARQVNVTVSPERGDHPGDSRQVDPRVYEAYLKGMFYVSQNSPESREKGMQYLHQAVEIDPAEPLAYVGLSEGYVTLGHGGGEEPEAFPRARAAAEQALKLDPDRAEAVGTLADVALYSEWDWPKAERLFQRALELNSSLAMTHYHYAWYLALFDRLDEAIAEHRLARDLDPLRALNTGWLGGLYVLAGRFDDAIVEARKALELSPTFAPSYQVLRNAYSKKGMHQEAIAAARRYFELNPSAGGVQLVIAYATAGRREEALKVLSTLDPSAAPAPQVALMHVALGDTDAALRALEAGYEAHRATLPWIRVHGNGLEPLRDEPRFRALLERMKLPAS